MDKSVNPDEMWTCQEQLDIRSKNFWGKLRVKYDQNRGFYYYDVLVGKKGEKEFRVHMGYDLIGNLFFNETRDKVAEIKRDLKSQLYGILPSQKISFNEPSPNAPRLKIQFMPKGSSSESKVMIFEIIESE